MEKWLRAIACSVLLTSGAALCFGAAMKLVDDSMWFLGMAVIVIGAIADRRE